MLRLRRNTLNILVPQVVPSLRAAAGSRAISALLNGAVCRRLAHQKIICAQSACKNKNFNKYNTLNILCVPLRKINIMPQISNFYGIIILMNFTDQAPAHFHAWYNEYKISVEIENGVVKGEMPARALRMVLEWLDLHREELMSNWEKAQNGLPLAKIESLK